MPDVPEITVSEVSATAYLLDVREGVEWLAGHIEGAAHIPMNQVPQRLAELPTDSTIVVICKVGGRSAAVTGYLVQQGLDAVNLAGGVVAWTAAGRPMVTDSGETARVY
ncbi:MAG: rhodanese-like domain-containing protein [Sporichthyaceae bacterium]